METKMASFRLDKNIMRLLERSGEDRTKGLVRSVRAYAFFRKWASEDPNMRVVDAIEKLHKIFGSEGEGK